MADEKTPEEKAAEEKAAEEKAAAEAKAKEEAANDPDAQLLAGARDPDAVRNALKSERAAAKAAKEKAEELAKKVQEFEDRDKSEQEKAEQRAAEAEKKAEEAEHKLLRLQVAADKKLPPELAARLAGSTKTELEADADELLKIVKPSGSSTGFDGGPRGRTETGETDPDALIRGMRR